MTKSTERFSDATTRFSDRVDDYAKYRPSYPDSLIQLLQEKTELGARSIVADVGSGTGILTRLLLATGAEVYAVEPNAPMRAAAEAALKGAPRFHSVDARAEATGLLAASIDLVTAAQAYHWFDSERAREEFARILRPAGYVAVIWNLPRLSSDFMRAYESAKERFGSDFRKVRESTRADQEGMSRFFRGGYQRLELDNHQYLDETGLIGRFFSSSYAPKPGDDGYAEAERSMREIFRAYRQAGFVRMDYATEVYLGKVR